MAKAASKGNNPRVIPEGKTQVNFNAPCIIVEKMQTIAFQHKYKNSDVYNQAFEKFVELYEKKNGPVKPAVKKKDIKL